jgi:hypothetical protein
VLGAKVIKLALPAMEGVVLEVVFTAKSAGDRSVAMDHSQIICNLNSAALDIDVLDAKCDAAFVIRSNLDSALAIIAFCDTVDWLNRNGGTAVGALAGNGFGHCRALGRRTVFDSDDNLDRS